MNFVLFFAAIQPISNSMCSGMRRLKCCEEKSAEWWQNAPEDFPISARDGLNRCWRLLGPPNRCRLGHRRCWRESIRTHTRLPSWWGERPREPRSVPEAARGDARPTELEITERPFSRG